MEFEVELRNGNWTARVRGTKEEVSKGGSELPSILEGFSIPVQTGSQFAHDSNLGVLLGAKVSSTSLADSVLLAFLLGESGAMTKDELADVLKRLGKAFTTLTLENKTVPLLRRKGLLHYQEVRANGSRGQATRAYFLTASGKVEADRIAKSLATSK